MPVPRLLPAALLAVLALAACDTAEERAEGHYQRATELAAAGDVDRALVELRNVFRLDGGHDAARLAYARLLRDRGETREALGQYLRLTEQDPDNVAGRRELAELALVAGDFETAAAQTARAHALAPDDPQIRALKAAVDYRAGEDRAAAVALAEAVIAETPGSVPAQMVVIAGRLDADDPQAALAQIDAALAAAPGDEGLHLVRLATLERLGDTEAVGAELQRMAGLFPDNPGLREAQVAWHMRQGDPDAALALLRAAADAAPGDPEPALTVAQFLLEMQGPEAAGAELDRLIAAAADPRPFLQARAGLDYAHGRRDQAIAALRGLLEGAEPSDTTRELQVTLATMLAGTGAAQESAALVATVLEGDPGQVAALKLRARAAIADDRPEAAIQDMRAALTQAPRDPEIMTIMALAHEREGARALMGERLALAVEASDHAPGEAQRYANFLLQEGRTGPAESVAVEALRRAPEDRGLLNMLGRIHLARGDWERAAQVADLLRIDGDPVAAAMAGHLEVRALAGQGRTEETVALLEQLAGAGADAEAMAALVRARVAAGEAAEAAAYLDAALAEDPANLPARFLRAGLHATRGEDARAEALYRDLVAEAPDLAQPYQALFALLAARGRTDDAGAVLEAGIAAAADNGPLIFIQAGLREAAGDIPGAIARYEELYARDGGDPVVANNLASLMTADGAEAGQTDRAFAIARRLSESPVPQFRDTYGWILHLRGDSARALDYLRPAAEALPGNAQVQWHRGEAEYALGRLPAARDSLAAALAAHDAGSPLPRAADIRGRLAGIEAELAAAEAGSGTGAETAAGGSDG